MSHQLGSLLQEFQYFKKKLQSMINRGLETNLVTIEITKEIGVNFNAKEVKIEVLIRFEIKEKVEVVLITFAIKEEVDRFDEVEIVKIKLDLTSIPKLN